MPARADTASGRNWANMLQPYLKSYQIFQCPSNPRNTVNMEDDTTGLSKISYAPNTFDTRGLNGGGIFSFDSTQPPLSLAAIQNPSTTISNLETNYGSSSFLILYAGLTSQGNAGFGGGSNPALFSGHLGTANYLFADGHVKSLRPLATISPVNMWNRDNTAYSGSDLTTAQTILKQAQDFYN